MSFSEIIEQASVKQNACKDLAEEFVSLIWPRLMNEYTSACQTNIDSLMTIRKATLTADNKKAIDEEVSKLVSKLQKACSEEVQTKVHNTMVELLAENLTEEELRYAIFHERSTVKIQNIASQLDSAFQKALEG